MNPTMWSDLVHELENHEYVKSVEYENMENSIELIVEFNMAGTWDIISIPMKMAVSNFLITTEYETMSGLKGKCRYEFKSRTYIEV